MTTCTFKALERFTQDPKWQEWDEFGTKQMSLIYLIAEIKQNKWVTEVIIQVQRHADLLKFACDSDRILLRKLQNAFILEKTPLNQARVHSRW